MSSEAQHMNISQTKDEIVSIYDINDINLQKEILNHAGISIQNLTDDEINNKYEAFKSQLASTYTIVAKKDKDGNITKLRINPATGEKQKDVEGYAGREIPQQQTDNNTYAETKEGNQNEQQVPKPINYND